MRLPDFLIIGAMKAGTTTLFRDLEVNPACFFSLDKEPHNLIHDAVLTPDGRAAYAALFEKARPDQRVGEASTGYTKRPTYEGVASRARAVLGPDLHLVYVVREPVARAVSHHYHALTYGVTRLGVDEAIRSEPMFIDYGRYAWQLEPWIDTFGLKQVHILQFESYVKDRPAAIDRISRFLGIQPRTDLVNPDAVFNKGDARPVNRGLWKHVRGSAAYRGIRGLIPRRAKDWALRAFLPKGPERPNPPTPATVDYILDRVRDDADRLACLMGRAQPLWDWEKVRAKYAEPVAPGPPGPQSDRR